MQTLETLLKTKVHAEMEESWPSKPERPLVLVVDDDEGMRIVAQSILEYSGYAVRTVAGGREALDLLKSSSGDVVAVLLDFVMPGMDGAQTMDEIRKLAGRLPIVMFSGMDDLDNRLGGRCPDAFLKKPFTIVELRQAIRHAIRSRAA